MKKISRNIVVGLIFSAAGFVALTAVPASAATSAPGTAQADSTQTTTSVATQTKSARVWEW